METTQPQSIGKTAGTSAQQTLSIPLLARLALAAGHYRGEGINHAEEKFIGEFSMKADLDNLLIEIKYRAVESDGVGAFHEERTWITDDLLKGGVAMWTVSTNTPGVLQMKLVEDSNDGSYSTRIAFRLGDPNDMTHFREEISLSIRHDKSIEYVYSWGVPHEKFAVKSRALLRPVATALEAN